MISHTFKTIMVHIPRTGGSSIEALILGDDMRNLGMLHEKHLTASQLKQKYPDEWKSYYKFAFIRNPWDKMVSLHHLNFGRYRPVNALSGNSLIHFLQNQVVPEWENKDQQCFAYLDEEVDFIGRFENYQSDACKALTHIEASFGNLPHIEKTEHDHYSKYYCSESRELVGRMFSDDIQRWGYEYEETS